MFDFFKRKPEKEAEASSPQSETKEEKKGLFSLTFEGLKKTLEKTGESLVSNVIKQVEQNEEFDEFILDDMEELLIKADIGVNTASEIVDKLRKQSLMKPSGVKKYLEEEFTKILLSAGSNELSYRDNEINIYCTSQLALTSVAENISIILGYYE